MKYKCDEQMTKNCRIVLGYWPYNEDISPFLTRVSKWADEVGGTTLFYTEFPDSFAIEQNSQLTTMRPSARSTILFSSKEMYHLFRLVFNRKEYVRYLLEEPKL